MKALLIKDLFLLKRQLQFIVMMIIISCCMIFLGNFDPTFAVSYLGFMGSMLVLNVLSYDEYNNGLAFLMVLPYSRKEYVKEKYILSLLSTIGCGLIGVIIAFIKQPVDILSCVTLILMASLIGIFEIPIQIKFGIEKSRIALVVSMACVVLAIVAIVSILPETFLTSAKLPIILLGVVMVVVIGSYQLSIRFMENKEF